MRPLGAGAAQGADRPPPHLPPLDGPPDCPPLRGDPAEGRGRGGEPAARVKGREPAGAYGIRKCFGYGRGGGAQPLLPAPPSPTPEWIKDLRTVRRSR